MIIGLGHRKRVGKDTFGEMLKTELERRGYIVYKLSFAKRMKDIANQIFFPLGLCPADYYDRVQHEKEQRLTGDPRSARQLWIEFGNAMRVIAPGIWIKLLDDDIQAIQDVCGQARVDKPLAFIITDVRFPNEADAINSWGGILVNITRPDAPRASDLAETALDSCDGWEWTVRNDSGLVWLNSQARMLAIYAISKHNGKAWKLS